MVADHLDALGLSEFSPEVGDLFLADAVDSNIVTVGRLPVAESPMDRFRGQRPGKHPLHRMVAHDEGPSCRWLPGPLDVKCQVPWNHVQNNFCE